MGHPPTLPDPPGALVLAVAPPSKAKQPLHQGFCSHWVLETAFLPLVPTDLASHCMGPGTSTALIRFPKTALQIVLSFSPLQAPMGGVFFLPLGTQLNETLELRNYFPWMAGNVSFNLVTAPSEVHKKGPEYRELNVLAFTFLSNRCGTRPNDMGGDLMSKVSSVPPACLHLHQIL